MIWAKIVGWKNNRECIYRNYVENVNPKILRDMKLKSIESSLTQKFKSFLQK